MARIFKNKSSQPKLRFAQTLMEVLIGVGVMGVVITGIAGLVSVSLQTARLSREKSVAQSLINDMLAAVKGIVQSDWHDLFSSSNGLGYWPLDDGAGTQGTNVIALDYISGNNGTLTIGPGGTNGTIANAWKSGSDCKSGSCIDLDGTDDYASVPDANNLDGMSALTVAAWVKLDSLPAASYFYAPVEKMGSVYRLLIGEGGGAGIVIKTTNNGWYAAGTLASGGSGTISVGSWAHITGTYDGSYTRIYINGVQKATGTQAISGAIATSTGVLNFGYATAANVAYLNGTIDEVRVYNRALSATEVANLYNGVNRFYPTQSAGVWQLKEGIESKTSSNIPFTRSFSISPVMRDSNNNIVSSGGNDDPLTKLITYTAGWRGRTLDQAEYVSRIGDSVFAQSDWSGGLIGTSTVFTAPNGFVSASSGVVYLTAGQLSNSLGPVASSSINNVYRYAWNDIIGWIDFYPITYSASSTEFIGSATTSPLGDISMNCLDQSACGSSNYKVYQKTTAGSGYSVGDLYGYGWSGILGWLSFNCNQTGVGGADTCGTANYKVSIATSTGDFSGFAWNDEVGWVSFNCNGLSICGTSDYKVKLNPSTGGFSADALESAIFDTQSDGGAVPVAVMWQGTLYTNNQVRFQIASSNNPNGPWNFIGNDGTGTSFYPGYGSAQPDTFTPISLKHHFNHRYLRYKIYLTSSDVNAPLVEDVSLIWKL